MAEMNFFFNLKERENFVKFCFDNSFSIIPDIKYEDNSYYIIKNIEHYHSYMSESARFFITCDTYQTHQLEMGNYYDKSEKTVYYIRQRYGGPSIDFYTPFLAELESNKIGPGLIGIYSFYYHFNEKVIPKTELKHTYRLLTSYIKKNSQKVKIGVKNYWLGKNTIERVKSGELKFVDMGTDIDWGVVLKNL